MLNYVQCLSKIHLYFVSAVKIGYDDNGKLKVDFKN